MIRISTIFIAICMVLVAASLGLILYSAAGLSGSESAIAALTARMESDGARIANAETPASASFFLSA